ncbi:MAG: hypothetical protein NT091_00380 [Candidatus Falkowbacteria bacterium]|nr:hypothetical protein [Candidatus Falkowbacteria bacterium]
MELFSFGSNSEIPSTILTEATMITPHLTNDDNLLNRAKAHYERISDPDFCKKMADDQNLNEETMTEVANILESLEKQGFSRNTKSENLRLIELNQYYSHLSRWWYSRTKESYKDYLSRSANA